MTTVISLLIVASVAILPAMATAQASYSATSTYLINVTPAPLRFGGVSVGSSATQAETVTNSAWENVVLTAASVNGTDFSISSRPSYPYTFSPGTSVPFRVKFAPQATGRVTGSMTVRYKFLLGGRWRWSSRTIQIFGIGTTTSGSLSPSPASLSFGTVSVSTTKTLSETLTNSESTAITISQITVAGTGYQFSGINPPATLSTGQSATFQVSFKPQTSGTAAGNLTISSNASNSTLSVSLSGAGSTPGQVSVSPSSINFGNVVVGTTQSQPGTVSAANGPVTLAGVTFSGPEFSIAGISFPLTLSAGQSASYKLNFAPSVSGSTSATVTWVSNATNSPPLQSLSGTGTPSPQHSVTLTWNASTSTNVVGYNIYRGGQSGGPYTQINTALNTVLQYIDYNVQGGSTYYYVVTAIDSAGKESAYSSEVKSVIPYP